MAFREKLAWMMMIVMGLAGYWYFARIDFLMVPVGQTPAPNLFITIGYVVIVVILSVIGSIVIAAIKPSEAEEERDERETIIDDKSGHWGGYVLAGAVITGLIEFGINGDGNRLFHLMFGGLMLSQILEFAFQIYFYRRGV